MNKPRTPTHRNCLFCGTAFTTQASIKLFCSPECRVRETGAAFAAGSDCWEWPKSLNPQTGYGQLSMWAEGKRILLTAHRVSYRAFIGEIPEGMLVCHTCDNRKCFNPAHLFVGTQTDNMSDCSNKGRFPKKKPSAGISWQKRYPEKVKRGAMHHLTIDPSCLPRGTQHHNAKVTEADVREIRASKETGSALAKRLGLTDSSVSSIRCGHTWKHVL
jgi:hypothetical protein